MLITKPVVSIIIPVYNCANVLQETLDSVLNQTYQKMEVLLIDDGSTDLSGIICDEYSKNSYLFKTFHIDNSGVAMARNFGLSYVTGDYVMFVDSDDLVKPNYVRTLVSAAEENHAEIVTCRHMDGRRHTPEEFNKYINIEKPTVFNIKLEDYKPIGHYAHNVVWKGLYASHLTKGLFFSDLYVGEDTLFFYQMFKRAGKLTFVDEIYYYYRWRADSLAHASYHERQADEITAWERVLDIFSDQSDEFLNEFNVAVGLRCKKNIESAWKARFDNQIFLESLLRKARGKNIYVKKSCFLDWKAKFIYQFFISAPGLFLRIKEFYR